MSATYEYELRPHGELWQKASVWVPEKEDYDVTWKDVTGRAPYYTNQCVVLGEGVTLRDLFALCAQHRDFYLNLLGSEFLESFLKKYDEVKDKAKVYTGWYDPEGLEYLELYWVTEHGPDKVFESRIDRPDFHGVGFVLKEDQEHYKAGTRIHWGISFCQLEDLLNLPLKYNPRWVLYNSDHEKDDHYGELVWEGSAPYVSLFSILYGVFWELGWYGTPDDAQEKLEEIKAIRDEHMGSSEEDCN
jgi:hypothetical protein